MGALYFDSIALVGKKIKALILRRAVERWFCQGKCWRDWKRNEYTSRTMFPLISTLCLFGGLFLVLVKVLLFAVEMVIVRHKAGDGDER